MARSPGASQGINSILVGARVLRALEEGRQPMPLAEVARRTELQPAKVHRYLTSLVRCGLASQMKTTGLYDLGPAATRLGIAALRRTPAVAVASQHAAGLRDRTGHTAYTSVWSETGPTLVRRDIGVHPISIVLRLGSTLPMLDSSVGLVCLASLPRSQTTEILKRQQASGETRRVPAAEIRALREEVERVGYAQTRNQMVIGLAGMAAPVLDAHGSLAAVIEITLPVALMTAREGRRLSREVIEAAGAASRELARRTEISVLPTEIGGSTARLSPAG